jgi:hypothetical protein
MPELSTTAIILGAAFAVQRVVEICDPVLPTNPVHKKTLSAVVTAALGCAISGFGSLSVFGSWSDATPPHWLAVIVTGLAIGAGTEGVNSVLKYAQYSKDEKKLNVPTSAGAPASPPPSTAAKAKVKAA